MIRCFIDDNVTTWDEELPLLSMALHATVHRQTGFTPNRMMLGREVILPLDLLIGHPNKQKTEPPDWVIELDKRMQRVHCLARERLESSQIRQKKNYDVRLRECTYEPGDVVYQLDETTRIGVSKKLCTPWKGPFLVVEARPPIFKIRFPKRTGFIHHDKLKPCLDRLLPGWLRRARHELFTDEANKDLPVDNQPSIDVEPEESRENEDEMTGEVLNALDEDAPCELTGEELPSLFHEEQIRTSMSGRRLRRPRHLDDYRLE